MEAVSLAVLSLVGGFKELFLSKVLPVLVAIVVRLEVWDMIGVRVVIGVRVDYSLGCRSLTCSIASLGNRSEILVLFSLLNRFVLSKHDCKTGV
jgi:hypothetical protein